MTDSFDTNRTEHDSGKKDSSPEKRALRRRVFEILEAGTGQGRLSKAFDYFIVALILLNVAAFVGETEPKIHAAWGTELYYFELFSVAIFTVEYLARLWTAVEMPFLSRLPAWQARWHLARSPGLIIDLLAILPFYLGTLFPIDLRILRLLRLLRLLKLSRYSPALSTLMRVVLNEQRALLGAGLLLLMAVLFSASVMYYAEHVAQPDKFGTIPQAMWWSITTLTTVGYGDVTPITQLGKAFGGLTMIVGLCILALPVAIIASGFSQELAKRDFVVNWSLISRVPFLAELAPHEAAEILPMLHSQALGPHVEIVPEGAPADTIFIVASGRVEHLCDGQQFIYQAGDCFGVNTMLAGKSHPGPFITRAKTKILKLHRNDFHRIELNNPELAARIRCRHLAAEETVDRE